MFFFVVGCKVDLHTNIDEKEANEMLSILLSHNISSEKRAGKNNMVDLLVEETQFGQAVDILSRMGLPRKKFFNVGDMFPSDGLVSSPTQEWARFNYARTQELSRTISSIPGIISADVHIANPRKETAFSEPPPASASVLIIARKNTITSDLIPKIKQLVAFSVEKIEYSRVSVVISEIASPVLKKAERFSIWGLEINKRDSLRLVLIISLVAISCLLLAVVGTWFVICFLRQRKEKYAS